MATANSSMTITTESWFIPCDILMIVFLVSAIIFVLFFLAIIILDKTFHTVPIMLVCNSCLSELVLFCSLLAAAVFSLQNDLKQIEAEDFLCKFRSYMLYTLYFAQNYSYLLQAIYRYICVVHSTRASWQSGRFQATLITIKWALSLLFPLPYIFTSQIAYLPDEQMCQAPLGLTLYTIYNMLFIYSVPITGIVLIYIQLVLYVRRMSKRASPVNTILQAQRDLKIVRNIVMAVGVLVAVGMPYMIFIFISVFTTPPRYHLRMAYFCVDISMVYVLLPMVETTEPVKKAILKAFGRRSNAVVPVTT